jgi:hypothetical protein
MSQGNKLKFQRGAAANTEFEDRNKGAENRHHDVTVWPARENLQSFSTLWRFEQGQVQECIDAAAYCERRAAAATDRNIKSLFEETAQRWRQLAKRIEQLERSPIRGDGIRPCPRSKYRHTKACVSRHVA